MLYNNCRKRKCESGEAWKLDSSSLSELPGGKHGRVPSDRLRSRPRRRKGRKNCIQVPNQLMEMFMICHRIEDVEKAVVFTPASHESVLLDLGLRALMS